MSESHARLEGESGKKHGDALASAMHEGDAQNVAKQHPGQPVDAVPPAEHGSHPHSAAAHLEGGSEHTKPEGNLRHGSDPGSLREPPMVVQRVGKQHRG